MPLYSALTSRYSSVLFSLRFTQIGDLTSVKKASALALFHHETAYTRGWSGSASLYRRTWRCSTGPAISRASLGSATESSEDIESQDSTSRISRHSTLTARPVSSSTCLVTEPSDRRVIFHAGESEGESDSDTAPQGRGGCCRVFSVEDGEDDEVVLVVVDDHTRSSFDRVPRMRSSGFGDVGGKAAPPEAPALRGEAVACARHGRLRRGGDAVGTPRLGRRETSCPRCTVMKGARLKGGDFRGRDLAEVLV